MSAVVSNNNNNTTIAVLGETACLGIAQNPSNHNQFLVTLSGDKKAHKVDVIYLFQLDIGLYPTAVFVAYQRKVKPRLTMSCLFSLTTVKFCSISHLFKCAYINK
jgi:hypothetical protein